MMGIPIHRKTDFILKQAPSNNAEWHLMGFHLHVQRQCGAHIHTIPRVYSVYIQHVPQKCKQFHWVLFCLSYDPSVTIRFIYPFSGFTLRHWHWASPGAKETISSCGIWVEMTIIFKSPQHKVRTVAVLLALFLSHQCWVTHVCVSKLGHHWFT